MSRAFKLFLTGFLSLVLLTSLGLMIFSKDNHQSSGPVNQLDIYHPETLDLDDINPQN